jgi:hypothetical protein
MTANEEVLLGAPFYVIAAGTRSVPEDLALARLTARPLDTTKVAVAATRAADLADRAEAAGLLVAASVLRAAARDLEEIVLVQRPPRLPRWLRS